MTSAKSRRTTNDAIRDALMEAASAEVARTPFHLVGRGHEARVTLDRSLAATVRGIELPCVVIEGFGANRLYPRRVFVAADELLRKRLGFSPYIISGGEVYRGGR